MIHSNWSSCVRYKLCPNNFSLHTTSIPALTHPSYLIPKQQGTTFSPLRISWRFWYYFPSILLSHYNYQAYHTMWFGTQKLNIPNQVPAFFPQDHCIYQTKSVNLINSFTKEHRDTLYGSTTYTNLIYPLNSEFLALFFPSATIATTPHYPEFPNKYPPYLSFSLHLMTNSLYFWPFFPYFHFLSQSHSQFRLVNATIQHWTDRISVVLPQSYLSHYLI